MSKLHNLTRFLLQLDMVAIPNTPDSIAVQDVTADGVIKTTEFATQVSAEEAATMTATDMLQHLRKLGINTTQSLDGKALAMIVAFMGSTQTRWRDELHQGMVSVGYNPQLGIGEWEESFAFIETLFKKVSAVLVYRLENGEFANGSLGSMAEASLSALLAYMSGQKVLVSLENDFEHSLVTPSTLIQWMTLNFMLEKLPGVIETIDPDRWTRTISTRRDEGIQELRSVADSELQHFQVQPSYPEDAVLKTACNFSEVVGRPIKLTITGSGEDDPYELKNPIKKELVSTVEGLQNFATTNVVSEGELGVAWADFYNKLSELTKLGYDKIETGLPEMEDEFNKLMTQQVLAYRDQVEIVIADDQVSLGAITEVPIIMLASKHVRLLCQPIDPLKCLSKQLGSDLIKQLRSLDTANGQQAATVLSNLGYDLKVFEGEASASLIKLQSFLSEDPNIGWKQIINDPILSKVPVILTVDGARRARSLVQSDLRKLQSEYPDLAYYEDADQYLQTFRNNLPVTPSDEISDQIANAEIVPVEVDDPTFRESLFTSLKADLDSLLETARFLGGNSQFAEQNLRKKVDGILRKIQNQVGIEDAPVLFRELLQKAETNYNFTDQFRRSLEAQITAILQ